MRLLALAATLLHVTVWPQGMPGPSRSWTLRCGPPGGSLPRAAIACRRLAALDHPFAPTPPGTACSQIFAGPQVALVTGRYRGRRVYARFSRRNGCETERWNRVRVLFPVPIS